MSLKVEYLGWAAFILTGPSGTRAVTDPYLLGSSQTKVPASPVKPEDVDVDLIIVSHCAGDHFGQALEILSNSDKSKLLGDHSTLCLAERAGYGGTWDPRMELTTSGATYEQGDFIIHAVDARHIAFKHFPDGSYLTGEPLCYIIEVKDGPTCFFGGDTSVTYDMKLWGELFHPDIAFIGIGGVDLGGRSLDEMNLAAAEICAVLLGVKKVIPMHYRTEEYLEKFRQHLAVRCPKCECIAMKAGEMVEFL
ncbi:MAG: MBL fold metallo-hydrolase [Clostridiales bacterium]|nr:MBL fold metallo-hydrolase [Clostridiales bacterium]